MQAENAPPHCGLAAARFADDPQRLAIGHIEGHAVDRPGIRLFILKSAPRLHERRAALIDGGLFALFRLDGHLLGDELPLLADQEMFFQIPDFEDILRVMNELLFFGHFMLFVHAFPSFFSWAR